MALYYAVTWKSLWKLTKTTVSSDFSESVKSGLNAPSDNDTQAFALYHVPEFSSVDTCFVQREVKYSPPKDVVQRKRGLN